jgi:hypothetical protein
LSLSRVAAARVDLGQDSYVKTCLLSFYRGAKTREASAYDYHVMMDHVQFTPGM